MNYRVGVDGGGSTTRAVVVDENHGVLGRAQSGSSNLYNLGLATATTNIDAAIAGALKAAQVETAQIASWGFGLAGATGEAQKAQWRESLAPLYGGNLAVDEDVAAALAGALGREVEAGGAVLIAGTGANCFGIARGQRKRADGWGPLLGDRGSGYWLGESAIRAAVAGIDGAGNATTLSSALCKYFQVSDLGALVDVVYAEDFRRDRVAGFVPHVLDSARAGDAVASELLKESGRLLAQTALAVLESLRLSRLAVTGGLLENSPEVRAALYETLCCVIGQHIEIVAPRYEAVVGAALLPELHL